jgi:phosphoribosylglycinamide formyltransferase-1
MDQKCRLVILISGNGTNLQAVLDAAASGSLQAQVTAVISNRLDVYGLERARRAEIPAISLPFKRGMDRYQYDRALARQVLSFQPDWVLLAGWMRILSMEFLNHFPGRVINIHPALPGCFAGTHAIERAWDAYRRGEIDRTGVMIHLVPDEGVDCGPVLDFREIPIHPEDTLESLEQRIHTVEHCLVVETLQKLFREDLAQGE